MTPAYTLALKYVAGVLAAGIAINACTIIRARGTDVSTSTKCLPASIRVALVKVHAECGIKIISTFRRDALIAGTETRSMHAFCRAADFESRNYVCAYAVLTDWPGKLSMDARRIGHVHIDDGKRARFTHGSSAKRYASVRK